MGDANLWPSLLLEMPAVLTNTHRRCGRSCTCPPLGMAAPAKGEESMSLRYLVARRTNLSELAQPCCFPGRGLTGMSICGDHAAWPSRSCVRRDTMPNRGGTFERKGGPAKSHLLPVREETIGQMLPEVPIGTNGQRRYRRPRQPTL